MFFPPFLCCLGSLLAYWVWGNGYLSALTTLKTSLLSTFASGFAVVALLCVVACALVFISPIGSVRLGGAGAKPLLKPFSWFAVTACTTVAVGILFWACAEPIYHYHSPPESLGISPASKEATRFSLSALFLHWTIIPYAIYTLPAVLFAFAYYNLGQPFSLTSCLRPLTNREIPLWLKDFIDSISLFALVAGMSASLATGILTLGGGISNVFGFENGLNLWTWITLSIVGCFVASSISGLHKGIRFLSKLNIRLFFALALFVFLFGPTLQILQSASLGATEFTRNFFSHALFSHLNPNDPWPRDWTVFYWANWMAWAPITALFLGRIGYGYTVRQFIGMNLFAPALFCAAWMAIFGGTALFFENETTLSLGTILKTQGPDGVIFAIFSELPFSRVVIPLFICSVFLSYVTAADSNTTAMASISSHGICPEAPEPSFILKCVWGIVIGGLALTMVGFSGIEGVKTLSVLGGLPVLFFEAFLLFSALGLCVLGYRGWETASES